MVKEFALVFLRYYVQFRPLIIPIRDIYSNTIFSHGIFSIFQSLKSKHLAVGLLRLYL